MQHQRFLYSVTAFIALAMALCLATTAPAQMEWTRTPFQQWSKHDVEKILSNSPWAKTQGTRVLPSSPIAPVLRLPGGGARGGSSVETGSMRPLPGQGERTGVVDYNVTLLLRSALPVRQALVRLKQLEANYDQMGDAERAAFDARTKEITDCAECARYYVITLSSRSSNAPGADLVYETFKGQTLSDLKNEIYIANDRGERRELAGFVRPPFPEQETIFLFQRYDDHHQPLFTAADKKLLFRMRKSGSNPLTTFTLDVAKFVLNGEVVF